jgi:hypothetical protein
MTTSVRQCMPLLTAAHNDIFCASAVSTMAFRVWQHVCCYSRPYTTAHLCLSSQQHGWQSVAYCVVIHYSKFCASVVSSMSVSVWQHVHCYTTAHYRSSDFSGIGPVPIFRLKKNIQMGHTGKATPNLQAYQVRWTPMLAFHVSSFNCGKIIIHVQWQQFFFFAMLYWGLMSSTTEHCFMAPKYALHPNLVAEICTVCGVRLLLLRNAQVPQLVPVTQFILWNSFVISTSQWYHKKIIFPN